MSSHKAIIVMVNKKTNHISFIGFSQEKAKKKKKQKTKQKKNQRKKTEKKKPKQTIKLLERLFYLGFYFSVSSGSINWQESQQR